MAVHDGSDATTTPEDATPAAAAAASKKRTATGEATTNLVLSASVGDNAVVFRDLMRLHVPAGSTVADVTWGKGSFWTALPDDEYQLTASDLKTGVDCRNLPYEDESYDCVVLDPPYMEGLFRKDTGHMAGSGTHTSFREAYSNGEALSVDPSAPKYHQAVLDLYFRAADEAYRVLKPYGMFVVKCQDEVSANKQNLTHVELLNAWADRFYCKDLFVVVRTNRPGVSRLQTQVHARKNHSYFLVLMKKDPAHPNRTLAPKRKAVSTKATKRESDK